DMAQPPPGLFVLWYNYYASSDSYYDRNGDKYSTVELGDFFENLPDVNVDIDLKGFASCPAIFWASNKKILGGARYMAGVVPIYMRADASVITEARLGVVDTVFTNITSEKLSGFTDIYFTPLTLAWGFSSFDATFAYGLTAPTGRYETGASDNLGLGFWTHQLQGFGYYYPVKDKSTAFMVGLTYEFNVNTRPTGVYALCGNRSSISLIRLFGSSSSAWLNHAIGSIPFTLQLANRE
ncbi:MAG TPA: transporter, partial [Ohtaekwangia sp.]